MAFPSGPYTDGQTHTEAGIAYTYSAAEGAWIKSASGGPAGVNDTRLVSGSRSVSGGGSLVADRTMQLAGDVATPAASAFYGTINNAGSPKGFYSTGYFFYNNSTTYVGGPISFNTINSLTGGGNLNTPTSVSLVNDVAAPGPNMVYGTDAGGVRGWIPNPVVADPNGVPNTRRFGSSSSIINLNTAGGNDTLERNLTPRLVGDNATPGNRRLYGTNSAGTKGWYSSRIPGWQRCFFSTPIVLAASTTAMNRFSNGGGTGDYAFNSTATQTLANRVQRIRFTVKTTEPGRNMNAWVGSLGAVLITGTTDSNGFFTASIAVNPNANWPISLRNGGSQSATVEYCEIMFMIVD